MPLVAATPAAASGAGQAVALLVPYVGDLLAAFIGPQEIKGRYRSAGALADGLQVDVAGGQCPRCLLVRLAVADVNAVRQATSAAPPGGLERATTCGCGRVKATIPGEVVPHVRARLPTVERRRLGSWSGVDVRTRMCGSCGGLEFWVPAARGAQPDDERRLVAALSACDCLTPSMQITAFAPELALRLEGRYWWGMPRTRPVQSFVCTGCGVVTLWARPADRPVRGYEAEAGAPTAAEAGPDLDFGAR